MRIKDNTLIEVKDEDITNGIFIIPDNIISIRNYAFSSCDSLASVVIPDSVTSIGDLAFSGCYSLTSITLPNSVKSIGYGAFSRCRSLMSITIGSGMESIKNGAFHNCDSLVSKKSNYKAFRIRDGELYCLNKKYIEGIENLVAGDLELCKNGIHYCTNLFEIFNYYSGKLDEDIAIYEIEVGNKILTGSSSKCCTDSCVLKKRLYKEDIIRILNGEEI